MSTPRFIGDLHLGHKKIAEFSGPLRGNIVTVEEHDIWIIKQWNSVVNKRDTVHVLGDVCFDLNKLPLLKEMNGNKVLYMGNHDQFGVQRYLEYFKEIFGIRKYKGFWLSHAPVHPDELRGLANIHGHVHSKTIQDPRYINVSVESIGGLPISLNEAASLIESRKNER